MGKHSKIEGTLCEQVAALPWRLNADGQVRVLLITSRTNGKWMLPKGWPMAGKTACEAALVEAREEAGIDGDVSATPIGSYRYLKLFDDGVTQPAQAQIFPIRVTAVHDTWDESRQRQRQWMRPRKAASMVFEPDLKRFLLEIRSEALALF